MSDEAYHSTLEELDELAELLSPTSAQLWETTVADFTQQFEFPDLIESSSIDFGVHTNNNMSTDTAKVKQLKGFFVDTNPITDVDFPKNEVIIPKNKHGTEGSKEYSSAYALATTALIPKLGAAKHFVTKNEDGETDPGNGNYQNKCLLVNRAFKSNLSVTMQRLRMHKSILLVMISWRLSWVER